VNILAMCITWNRPKLLGRSIYSFLQQMDKNARLFILDDAGQYKSQEHERWTLHSTKLRYPTMGDKRNALLDMAICQYPEIEGFMLWDDDDVYFPHATECVSKALDQWHWAQPRTAIEMSKNGGSLRRVETFNRTSDLINQTFGYGGCWAWRINTFMELGRFPSTNDGEDAKVAGPCQEKYGPSANSTPDNEPWYYYNCQNNSISGEGQDFYTLRGTQEITPVEEIPIGWNGTDIFSLPMEPGVHLRSW